MSAHQQLPLLVAEALNEHVLSIELSAAITAFLAVLHGLDALLGWSDPNKRPAVVAGRFSCALNALSTLDALLAGEAEEATKYDTACLLLAAQVPKQVIPSLAAFHQLDRHLAAEGFDLSGDTAAERIGTIGAREVRDTGIERAAPYGGAGGGSGGGGGSGKTALVCDLKPRLHIKASVKVLQLWLNSSNVAGPIVYTVAPVAAAFGVAPVAGVPDETRSGVGALIKYHAMV